MAAYYTRANSRGEVELEDVEQGDSTSMTTTTPTPIIPVGLQGVSTRESGSMSAEVAGPVTTHPQLLPEGGHSLWVDTVIQGLLTLSKWGLPPWDTPVDLQIRLRVLWLVQPMF